MNWHHFNPMLAEAEKKTFTNGFNSDWIGEKNEIKNIESIIINFYRLQTPFTGAQKRHSNSWHHTQLCGFNRFERNSERRSFSSVLVAQRRRREFPIQDGDDKHSNEHFVLVTFRHRIQKYISEIAILEIYTKSCMQILCN
jgi:hypothetical protein